MRPKVIRELDGVLESRAILVPGHGKEEARMKRFSILTSVVLASLLLTAAGCSKDSSPTGTYREPTQEQQEIQAFLVTSEYALPEEFHSDQSYEGQGVLGEVDESAVSQAPAEDADVLPWVRFVRLARVRPRVEYIIQVPGASGEGTADVRVIHHIVGTFIVDGTRDQVVNPFFRHFTSLAVRNLMLRKTEGGWTVEKISPVDVVSTNDGGTTIRIVGMGTRGSSGTHPEVRLASPDTLLSLDELPRFAPGDTILVAARAASSAEDGCWLFLHVHGGCYGPHAYVFHWRIPFVRDASDPTLFRARLPLPNAANGPRVIHMAVDGIGWNTLFGDETVVYNSRMWAMPCVIKGPEMAVN